MGKRTARRKPEGYVFGRPTLYKDKYVQGLEDYFNKPAGKVTINSDAGAIYLPSSFPTKAGYACEIGVDRDTLKEWAQATNADGSLLHPEFSDTYKERTETSVLILRHVKRGKFSAAYKGGKNTQNSPTPKEGEFSGAYKERTEISVLNIPTPIREYPLYTECKCA